MDFTVDVLWVWHIGGMEVWITRTIFNTWVLMACLVLFALFVRLRLHTFRDRPRGFQNAVEAMVELFDTFLKNTGGEKLMPLSPWFFTVFAFLLLSNFSGVIGLRPPTADWATAFAFALGTFVLIQVMGLRYRKGAYLKSFFEPNPIFFPLNLIGELSRPVSLSFRLFGNVLSGLILLSMVYQLAPVFLRFVLPAALHFYFDLFIGALQAYIFCVLSLMFIRGAAE
ncbi:MAG: F0F1 ATP synthase subunit A [Eubacteriales bacterium]